MSQSSRPLRSDPPVEDLKRERDAFIQQFFRRGAQISEELLADMERLRTQVQTLEAENARLRQHLASDDAIKQLLTKIHELENEKEELIAKSIRPPPAVDEYAKRFAEMENELADLGTLHVAGIQLHNGTTVRRAIRNVKELCAQFLGAQQFAIYVATDDASSLVPIAVEGLSQKEARQIMIDDGVVFTAFAKNQIYVDPGGEPSSGSVDQPAAAIPIAMAGRSMGAIAIFRTLPQKTSFTGVDHELFKLLGAQAAPALVNARLFTESGRRIPDAQAFIEQED